MMKYRFVKNFSENEEKKNVDIKSFYQICIFPEPKKNIYNLRRFFINDKNEFLKIKTFGLNKTQLEKFIKKKKNNEYKFYSTYNLDYIDYPTMSDILILKSDILSNCNYYYGQAPF